MGGQEISRAVSFRHVDLLKGPSSRAPEIRNLPADTTISPPLVPMSDFSTTIAGAFEALPAKERVTTDAQVRLLGGLGSPADFEAAVAADPTLPSNLRADSERH